MANAMLDLLGVTPVQIVYVYALTRLLTFRRKRLFWTLEMLLFLSMVVLRSHFGPWYRIVFGIALSFGLPFFLAEEKASRKLLVLGFSNAMMFVAELLGAAIGTFAVNLPYASYDAARADPSAFLYTHAAHLLIFIVLLAGLYALLSRFAGSHPADSDSLRYFAWFPLMQVVLVTLVLEIQLFLLRFDDSLFLGGGLLAVLCIAVDIMLLVAINRFRCRQFEERRAALLQRQLDGYLTRYYTMMEDVENVALWRHDLRNHLQVVSVLVAHGECERACKHVGSMLRDMDARNGAGCAADVGCENVQGGSAA